MECRDCEGWGRLCDGCGNPAELANVVNMDLCKSCYGKYENQQERKFVNG